MKFSIAVNMARTHPGQDVRQVVREMRELVCLAESGGFEIAWAAEHHTIELMAGPNPVHHPHGLGRAHLAYPVGKQPWWWRPTGIPFARLAGEAALFDVFSEGRLELGLGRGAFQYEFDRMAGGIDQREGGKHLREMLPALVLLGLWRGDIAHDGEIWRLSPRNLSPEAAADTASADLGGGARSGHTFGMGP